MTLNGVIAFILRYFTEVDSLQADYVTVVEDRPMLFTKYSLPVTFGQKGPAQKSHGVFATSKLLVRITT